MSQYDVSGVYDKVLLDSPLSHEDDPGQTRYHVTLTQSTDETPHIPGDSLAGAKAPEGTQPQSLPVERQESYASFEWDELAMVLSHYNLGVIKRMIAFKRGSRRAPKCVLHTEHGTFLLKRSRSGTSGLEHRRFVHALQRHLIKYNFPAPPLVGTGRSGSTMVRRNQNIYELYAYIHGTRYNRSQAETVLAGRTLAMMHGSTELFLSENAIPTGSYHNSAVIRSAFERLPITIGRALHGQGVDNIRLACEKIDQLMSHYELACEHVEKLGYNQWDVGICHGDYHPGNLIFNEARDEVISVVDFDSARQQPLVADVANGAFQFSAVGAPNPTQWPDAPDPSRLRAFLSGYVDSHHAEELSEEQTQALPWLMVEAMLAETILPIAARGYFAHVRGDLMLETILRKAQWFKEHAENVSKVAVPT